MSEQKNIEKCYQCNAELFGQFCANCGQPQSLNRINRTFILSEIGSVLNFQKGILFTIKELLLRPGINIKKFIHEDRKRLVKPISFIILSSLIYIILQHILSFEDAYMSYSELDWEQSTIGVIMNWISNNYGFANILMANFIALWVKLFFRKYDYNFFEILILLYFIMGIQMLLFSFFGILDSISGWNVSDKGSLIGVLYVCWAIGQFFDKGKKLNYLKALLSYFLGMLSFLIVVVACGMLIDLL